MNFGGFLDTAGSGNVGGNGNGASRIIADLSYLNHHNHRLHDEDEDGNNKDGDMPSPGVASVASHLHHSLSKSMFCSPGLSLALQTSAGFENHGQVNDNTIIGGGGGGENCYEGIGMNKRSRDDFQEQESRSGSDNLEGVASGDDQDAADYANLPARKKRYHRHTPQQIQELEA